MADKTLAEQINDMEFDHVFTLHPDGSITHPKGIWAPEVYHSEENDIDICGRQWRALTGMTRQDSYYGAVMHQSECIGRGIADYLQELAADEPVTFVVTSVECLPEDGDDVDPFPAGWAILYRVEG